MPTTTSETKWASCKVIFRLIEVYIIWNLIRIIGGNVLDIAEDKNEANTLKFQTQLQLIKTKNSKLEALPKFVLVEADGSLLQCNWRPLLMVVCAALVVVHWFRFTTSNIPESV